MSKTETPILHEIMCAASNAGMTIWRNNTGSAWQGRRLSIVGATIRFADGRQMKVPANSQLIIDARPVDFGLCKGSADLIGLRPVTIKQEHVGTTIAQFVAIEVKTPKGRTSEQQMCFLDHVHGAGGVAVVARSTSDLNDV